MHRIARLRSWCRSFLLAAAALLLPAAAFAQVGGLPLPPVPPLPIPTPTSPGTTGSTVVGDAGAVRSTVLGLSMALGDTGTLSGVNDVRDASAGLGSIPSVLSAETLSAATMSWTDEVDSVASLTNLNLAVAGVGITADMVMAQASQVLGTAGSGSSILSNLAINGVPINVTGAPNQVIAIPGGQVVINEQTVSSTGAAVVNALHVTIAGVADVVVASAAAGIS